MAAAKNGSANASMRSTVAPNWRISSTGERNPIISGAKTNITTPMNAITPMPRKTVIRANDLARLLCPAPMLCPTSVVAASPIPYPGI